MTFSSGSGTASFSIPVSVTGHSYQLQSTTDLASGNWQNVPGSTAQSGNGGPLQFAATVTPSVPASFFRIVISLQ
jgi:hypothetical protein